MRSTITLLILLMSLPVMADPQSVSNGYSIANNIFLNIKIYGGISLAQLAIVLFVRVLCKPKKAG